MLSWASNLAQSAAKSAQSGISAVAGTAEPVYGPDAIHPVVKQVKDGKPFTELQRKDLQWRAHDYTNVETQTFYLVADSGHIAMIQILYSNIVGIRTTAQFSTKVYHPTETATNIWKSTNLTDFSFDEAKQSIFAESVDVSLSEDGNSFTVKSVVEPAVAVNFTMTRECPGFKIADDGTTYYGTDAKAPWGHIRHVFWPRTKVEGAIVVNDQALDFKGKGQFVMALQAMKPHHAASTWKLTSFQGPTLSAMMMQFITPPSYANTSVAVGGIAKGEELISCTVENEVQHVRTKKDEEAHWDEPTAVKVVWKGPKVNDSKVQVEGTLESDLGERIDRLDLMAAVPGFVKSLVGGIVGTRPYIYQYVKKATLKVKSGEQEFSEEGNLFYEVSFIC